MSHEALVVAATYLTEIDADLARSALDAAGIDSMVRADDCGGVSPGLTFTRGVQVLVRSEDAERAAQILNTDAVGADLEPEINRGPS
jgi:hypothetical protein